MIIVICILKNILYLYNAFIKIKNKDRLLLATEINI
jgi:hypothetical protein